MWDALCCTELEALGDDFLTEDDDTTFLDAANAPEPPTKVPGGTETVSGKVRMSLFFGNFSYRGMFCVKCFSILSFAFSS